MNWQQSGGPDLLPPNLPRLSGDLEQLFFRLVRRPDKTPDDQDLVRTLMWAAALQRTFEYERLWTKIAGFRFVAYGFADPVIEANAFGVIAYVAREDLAYPLADGRAVRVDDHDFPIVVRQAEFRDHAAPDENPRGASSACWARLNAGPPTASGVDTGFLTAPHALNPQPAKVGMLVDTNRGWSTSSGQGEVLAIGPVGIEAAVVAPGLTAPNLGLQLTATHHPAPWTDVDLIGYVTNVSTKITSVTDTRGTLNPLVPATIFTADAGTNGDSGGIVRTSSEGVGIYRGDLVTGTGVIEGRAQHLAQAAMALDLTLYE